MILEGFRELESALAQLPKATGKNVLRRVAKGALEPMARQAESYAPVREGDLRESITVSERRTRRVNRSGRFDRKTGVEMAMGPASGEGVLNYAALVEFGTVDTPAQPYMRPAWDSGQNRALEYVKDNLAREILDAARRVAHKGARLLARGL